MSATLIGIAGPSGSGKSELAHRLSTAIAAPIISLDNYYRSLDHLSFEDRAASNFDEPAALEDELLLVQLSDLANGRPIQVPVYDFSRHTRIPGEQFVSATGYVIIEGLFTLYWNDLRRILRLSVYVDLEDEICFDRRLERDVRERGRTPECVRRQYDQTVRPMAEKYIWPTRRHADLIIRGDAQLDESVGEILGLLR
jgi:uridine kinase